MDTAPLEPAVAANTPAWKKPGWKRKVMIGAGILGSFLVVCWILVIYDAVAPAKDSLVMHGIIPRTKKGLVGIISSPFIHIGFEHVEADSLGVIILGSLLMMASFRVFFSVTAFVWVVSGFLTWCVGRANFSIVGAGIVCFGWFGYLILTPFFARPISPQKIAVAAATGILYGGLIFGVFPSDPRVAWEANLCGIFAGILCSVGYWFAYLRWFRPKFLSKQVPVGKSPMAMESFADATTAGDNNYNNNNNNNAAIVLPHKQAYSSPPQAHLLKGAESESYSPFDEQPVHSNSSEPAWLNVNNAQNSAKAPTTNNVYSSNPSWLIDTPPVESSKNQASNNWNPFG